MRTVEAVRMQEEQIGEAGRALALAFQNDPLQSYTFPDPDERARRSPAHFEPLLRYGHRFGEVLVPRGAADAAAVWLPPGATDITPKRMAEVGLERLGELIGEDAAERFEAVLCFVEPYHCQAVPADHWYLMVIGVSPTRQGQGVGKALIQPILERADADRVPCYLETTQSGNVGYYQSLGFQVLVETIEPKSGLRIWTFRREPGGGR